jgi:hypothetical protein
MIVPRSWSAIQHQRYPEQVVNEAAPSATDNRFKAGAFLLLVSWLITVFSLRHSIKYYCPRNRGIFNRFIGFLRYTPLRFMIIVPLAAALIAYQVLVAFRFDYSPLKVGGINAAIFAGGYTPSLLIVFVQVLFGFINPNEDKELQRQRRVRNQQLNQEMGLVPKPSWWSRINGEVMDPNAGMRERLMRNVQELHGTKATGQNAAPQAVEEGSVEMTPVSPLSPVAQRVTSPLVEPYTGRSERRREERAREMAAGLLFPDAAHPSPAELARRREELMMDGPPPPSYTDALRVSPPPPPPPPNAGRRISAQSSAAGSTNQPPQQIRSMLDI